MYFNGYVKIDTHLLSLADVVWKNAGFASLETVIGRASAERTLIVKGRNNAMIAFRYCPKI